MRTIVKPVRRHYFLRLFFPGKFLLGAADLLQFPIGAIAHGNLFTWHEENLPDRHIMGCGDPLSGLKDVAELGFVGVLIRLDPNNQHRSNRPIDQVEDRSVDRVPPLRRPEICRSAQRNRPRRCAEIFRNDKCAHQAQSIIAVHRSFPAQNRNVFLDHSNGAHWQYDRDGEERFESASWCPQRIVKLVTSLSLELDMKRFFLRERRIDKISKSAASLQDRAVTRVLRQERPQTLAMRFHADTRTNRVVEKPYFHSRIVGHELKFQGKYVVAGF